MTAILFTNLSYFEWKCQLLNAQKSSPVIMWLWFCQHKTISLLMWSLELIIMGKKNGTQYRDSVLINYCMIEISCFTGPMLPTCSLSTALQSSSPTGHQRQVNKVDCMSFVTFWLYCAKPWNGFLQLVCTGKSVWAPLKSVHCIYSNSTY